MVFFSILYIRVYSVILISGFIRKKKSQHLKEKNELTNDIKYTPIFFKAKFI